MAVYKVDIIIANLQAKVFQNKIYIFNTLPLLMCTLLFQQFFSVITANSYLISCMNFEIEPLFRTIYLRYKM